VVAAGQGVAASGGKGVAAARTAVDAGKPGATAALAQGADELAGLLDEESGGPAATLLRATEATAGESAASSPNASLTAWASATQRLAGGQDAYERAATPSDGHLREPVGSGRWKNELGVHLTMMATQGQQSGSLRLSPEHLGPMEIQINVGDDKTTSIQFGAQNAETRAALQEALPRLREMFAAAGLQLGDAGVSGQAPRPRPEDLARADEGGVGPGDGEPTRVAGPVRSITHSGLLDTYA
jgi:flagellar hook-length control protein FliK